MRWMFVQFLIAAPHQSSKTSIHGLEIPLSVHILTLTRQGLNKLGNSCNLLTWYMTMQLQLDRETERWAVVEGAVGSY